MTNSRKRSGGALNVRDLEPGTKLRLSDGRVVQITENPLDGYWLACRDLADSSTAPGEEMILFNEVVSVEED